MSLDSIFPVKHYALLNLTVSGEYTNSIRMADVAPVPWGLDLTDGLFHMNRLVIRQAQCCMGKCVSEREAIFSSEYTLGQ